MNPESPQVEADPVPTVHVDFAFRSENIDGDEITRALGLAPSLSWNKGDEWVNRDGRRLKRLWTVWHFRSAPAVQSDSLDDHVKYMLAALEPRLAVIEPLRARSDRTSINISYEIAYSVASFSISSDLIARLSRFADAIDFSVIALDPAPPQSTAGGPNTRAE
jgi:hypothetical protein